MICVNMVIKLLLSHSVKLHLFPLLYSKSEAYEIDVEVCLRLAGMASACVVITLILPLQLSLLLYMPLLMLTGGIWKTVL